MGNIIAPGDKALFSLLDKFQTFINETNFIDNYRDWKDILQCLEKNCEPLKDYLFDDDFLYYDDKHKNFIMPIDINNGKLRIYKFFEIISKDERKQCDLIERRYYQYLADKKQILHKAAQKAKKNKVKDEKNPFLAAAATATGSVKDTFNTLF
jgi:hypothetical protein